MPDDIENVALMALIDLCRAGNSGRGRYISKVENVYEATVTAPSENRAGMLHIDGYWIAQYSKADDMWAVHNDPSTDSKYNTFCENVVRLLKKWNMQVVMTTKRSDWWVFFERGMSGLAAQRLGAEKKS